LPLKVANSHLTCADSHAKINAAVVTIADQMALTQCAVRSVALVGLPRSVSMAVATNAAKENLGQKTVKCMKIESDHCIAELCLPANRLALLVVWRMSGSRMVAEVEPSISCGRPRWHNCEFETTRRLPAPGITRLLTTFVLIDTHQLAKY
jgi:hypothetical protein